MSLACSCVEVCGVGCGVWCVVCVVLCVMMCGVCCGVILLCRCKSMTDMKWLCMDMCNMRSSFASASFDVVIDKGIIF